MNGLKKRKNNNSGIIAWLANSNKHVIYLFVIVDKCVIHFIREVARTCKNVMFTLLYDLK